MLVQINVFPLIFSTGWQPDLIMIWVVLITILKGYQKGLIVAFVGALAQDIVIGNIIAFHALSYLILVFIFSRLSFESYEEQWYIPVVSVFIATIINDLVQMLILYLNYDYVGFWSYLWNNVLPEVVINSILAILVNKIIWKLTDKEEYFW